jgi:hypothetical protein
MDSQLGQIGISRVNNNGIGTIDAWAVQTGAVQGGIITTTGFDCYFSSRCGTPTSSVTPAATTLPVSVPHSSNGGTIALGICVPILAFLLLYFSYRFLRNRRLVSRLNRPLRPVPPAPPVEQINPEILMEILLATQQNQTEGMQRIARAIERLTPIPREDPLPPGSSTTSRPLSISTVGNSATTYSSTSIQEAFQEMERELSCPICMNIFHNPVSVISRQTGQNGGCCEYTSIPSFPL